MAEKLERLKLKRRGQRGVVTKYRQEATSLLEADPIESSSIRRLKTLQGLLEEKRAVLKGLDDEIIDTCPVDEVEGDTIEAEELSGLIAECIDHIKSVITERSEVRTNSTSRELTLTSEIVRTNNSTTPGAPALHSSSRSGSPLTNNVESLAAVLKPKLPKIELPKFSGDVTKFRSFWEGFESSVDQNPRLSTIDKFNYLRALVEGTAARSIQGLALTEANYSAATDILKERFGKKQQIISGHMKDLLKLPSCTGDKTSHLRLIYDKIHANVRGLEALGVGAEQYGSCLIPIVMDVLPADVCLQIARVTTRDVWEINELLQVLRTEVEAREVSEKVKVNETHKHGIPQFQRKSSRETAAALVAREAGSNSVTCVYCREGHYSASCGKVTSILARRDILRKEGRCFLCLMKGHRASDCQSHKRCRKCGRKHHQSLCDPAPVPHSSESHEVNTTTEPSTPTTTTIAKSRNSVLLQTARSRIYTADNQLLPVRILLDNGSQRSYITNALKSRLKLVPLRRERLNVNTFGNTGCKREECDVISVTLQGLSGEDIVMQVLGFPTICSPLKTPVAVNQYPHLNNLDLADVNICGDHFDPIDILIGSDYYWHVVTGDIIRGENGPVALSSHFGWLLSGPTDSSHANHTVSTLIIDGCADTTSTEHSDTQLSQDLCHFWDTEAIGVTEQGSSMPSKPFPPELAFDWLTGRYQVGLPWKTDTRPTSDCYSLCVSRLNQLYRRLKKSESLLREYDGIFHKQEEDGIIERVPPQESSHDSHFLPHHGVLREDKSTTKLRVVFDGSAKSELRDLSLNDCLEKGPNNTPHIFDILLRFRSYPIGIVADIEKAFHQVVIDPQDRDMLRFLWLDNLDKDSPVMVQYRFCRLVFGLTPSPAILTEVINHHTTRYLLTEPNIAEILSCGFYVDDFTSGAKSIEEGVNIYQRAKQLMKQGGFNLRKWRTNSRVLQQGINTMEGEAVKETVEFKLLGVCWDVNEDMFQFDFRDLVTFAKSLPSTKRSILRASAKIFDPLGILSPFVIGTKILFQTLCKCRVDWDAHLEGDMLHQWNNLIQEFEILSEISIPRCYFLPDQTIVSQQLHGFSDASGRAYAAVVYLRTEYQDGHVSIRLIASKTRVAPLKEQTIPRLELLGATILSRLISAVKKEPSLDCNTYCWTDSLTVLCWVKNSKQWKQYVRTRVEEIRRLTEVDGWRFCPGTENPADIPSRSCRVRELVHNQLWWNGPPFLKSSPEGWPDLPTRYDSAAATDEQVKIPPVIVHTLPTVTDGLESLNLDAMFDVGRYSCKLKLLRVTALVLKFIRLLKQKASRGSGSGITVAELREAEDRWVKSIQRCTFADEYRRLLSGGTVIYKGQLILFLNDEHVICCKGRLNQSDLPLSMKNPVLLPTKHRFTELLVQEKHAAVHHNGTPETLAAVREQYWIVKGRSVARKVIRRCIICRRYDGKPFGSPVIPDLPVERVSEAPPFSHTGIDFAGPLYVRSADGTECKVYVCLFTCASTRAVHLELTRELSSAAFLLAFRRFTSRRGLPTVIMSDNAKTFKHCSREIMKIARAEEVCQYMTNRQIEWKFIVEKAPWWGGFWERLIQSVKRCLRKTIGRSTLSFDELATVLVEIESTLNNRPLTYLYGDEDGPSHAVTPADLIYGHRIAKSSNNQQFEIVSTAKSLTKRARYQLQVLNTFVKQWRKDYLLSLQERRGILQPASNTRPVKEGETVILKEEGTAKCLWKLARVMEVTKGRDGAIRSAKIRLTRGDRRVCLRRPIQHLIPLEVDDSN